MDIPDPPTLDLAKSFTLAELGKLHGLFSMSEKDYRAAPGLNQSTLKAILKSPATYKQALQWESVETKTSKALEFGQLVHIMLLEGQHAFDHVAVEAPDVHHSTKIYKKAKKEAEEANKIMVSKLDMQKIRGIQESAEKDPIVPFYLREGVSECVAFSSRNNILRKGKIDYINFTAKTLIDIKTTSNADQDDFTRSARRYRYDIQAAWYLDLVNEAVAGSDWRAEKFLIFAVEKSPPYLWNYFCVPQRDLDNARMIYEEMIFAQQRCEKSGCWPGFPQTLKPLNFGFKEDS